MPREQSELVADSGSAADDHDGDTTALSDRTVHLQIQSLRKVRQIRQRAGAEDGLDGGRPGVRVSQWEA